jgi:segregation and condensation protein B
MNNENALPPPKSLQSVIGALLFGAEEPLSLEALRKILQKVGQAEQASDLERSFSNVSLVQIQHYLDDIGMLLEHADLGLRLCEEDGKFSLRTIPSAAPWLRSLLKVAPPQKLSRATLETLAIIAYRQPISRAEIESVRGVSVDHTIRALLELNLIRTVGRSALAGRPFLYGTTSTFLEHFGLKDIKELSHPFDDPMPREDELPNLH